MYIISWFRYFPLIIRHVANNKYLSTFFKWIKGNLTIKSLWGYSENAAKTHQWTATY